MYHYLYTNDMRIDTLHEKAKLFSKMFLTDSLPSSENKSLNNNCMTVGFYLNLVPKGNSAKLISEGKFQEVVLNIIKKFQYPNPRTKDSFRKSIEDGINLAPLREIVKLLFTARFSGCENFYLTKLEIENFIFFNKNVAKIKNSDIDRYKLIKEILEYRKTGSLPSYIANDQEKNWNQKDRQINELISILKWSNFISYENDRVILRKDAELSEALKAELYDIINFSDFWDYSFLESEENFELVKQSYFEYIDKDLEVYFEEFDTPITPPMETNFSSAIPLPKPFLLLAGVSGTGKSRFVRQQAEKTGEFQLVSVRPDWNEPSDLLGYVSRLSGKAEYVMTDVLKFIVKAWQAVENAGVIANGEVSGSLGQLADVPPFWLCLDEMNLAPVEQYFADYLAVLETREWKWVGDEFSYKTEALLSATAWADIVDFKKELNVSETLWDFFQKNGIGIPFNLIVAGTVNMDETTHAFSRKVLDRALSFDFSNFYPNDFAAFFEPKTQPKLLGYPIYSQATEDDNSAKSIAFLTALNEKLKETPFELAYRALNELLLSVVSFQPQDDRALQAVWDDFVMTKVLPRIEGDENKVGSVLDDLKAVLKNELGEIWDNPRPDLWRENVDGSELEIDCRCKPKLERMQKQFTERGMVSFW